TRADHARTWQIIVVGDHGEGLGDHHEREHGFALYRSTLHVPLIIVPRPTRALVHPKPWSLVDLDPTIREFFGLPPARTDGESLFTKGTPDRPLPCLTLAPSFLFAVNPVLGIRKGRYMLIKHA